MTGGNHKRQGRNLRERLLDWLPFGSANEVKDQSPPEPTERAPRVQRDPTGTNRRRENPLWVAVAWILPMGAAVIAFSTPFLGIQMHDYLMHTGHFFVRNVVVEGNQRLGEEDLLAMASIQAGTHLLAADLSDMEARLESHPWVARAVVQRDLPDKLMLSITEHRAVAYVVLDDLMLVNPDGVPFAVAEPQDDLDIPILTGLSPGAFDTEISAASTRSDIRAAVNLARLYGSMGLANRWPIAEIRLSQRRKMHLVLSRTGTEVALGKGPYREKLYRLEWVLEKLHQEGAVAEYLLLDGSIASNPDRDDGRVIVRADLAPTPEELAEEAHRRAELQAQRRAQPDAAGAPQTDPTGILPEFNPGDSRGNAPNPEHHRTKNRR